MFLLQIDDREHAVSSELVDVKTKKMLAVRTCRLLVGDFLISYKGQLLAVIERKTLADLAASIKDGRIKQQVANMTSIIKDEKYCAKGFTPKLIIILEGSTTGMRNSHADYNGISMSNLYTKCDHLMMRDGIHIIETMNTADTAARLIGLIDNFPLECLMEGGSPASLVSMSSSPALTANSSPALTANSSSALTANSSSALTANSSSTTSASSSSALTANSSSTTSASSSSASIDDAILINLEKVEPTKMQRLYELFTAIPHIGNTIACSLVSAKISICELIINPTVADNILTESAKKALKNLGTLEKILAKIPRCSKIKAKKIVQTYPNMVNWSAQNLAVVECEMKSGKKQKIGIKLARQIITQIMETI